jgi:sulfonate transport system substrate-binding protein
MAQAELEENARLFFRDPALNTYGFLNVRAAFAAEHPELVDLVMASYERGRRWALAKPDELARILSEASKVSLAVAERQLRHAPTCLTRSLARSMPRPSPRPAMC